MDERQRDFLVLVAYIYLRHSDAEDAVALLEAVYLSEPHDRDVIQLLAYGYLQIEKFVDSLEMTNYLLGGNHERVTGITWLMHCRALQGLGRHDEAKKLWKQSRGQFVGGRVFQPRNSLHEELRSIDLSLTISHDALS